MPLVPYKDYIMAIDTESRRVSNTAKHGYISIMYRSFSFKFDLIWAGSQVTIW